MLSNDPKDDTEKYCNMSDVVTREERQANAKLIAAAPDLLQACMNFVNKCDNGMARSKNSYAEMKAAIEKALK